MTNSDQRLKEPPIKLLYVVGSGRSGSTLLEHMLAQNKMIFPMGEFRRIWKKSFVEDQLCDCGLPFSECSFWTKVVTKIYKTDSMNIANKMILLQKKLIRFRYIPVMLFNQQRFTRSSAWKEFSSELIRLLREIHLSSGCQVLVESSKDVRLLLLYHLIPEVEPYVVHLVRDSRAVSFSWMRKKRQPAKTAEVAYLPIYSIWYSAWRWFTERNLMTHLCRFRFRHYYRLRYEDLVNKPKSIINEINEFVEIDGSDVSFIKKNTVTLDRLTHSVSGNPVRFKKGEIYLRLDDEWKTKMTLYQKLAVTILTFPLLIHYGYFKKKPVNDE